MLKTGTLRHQNAMQHLANALDAEAPGGIFWVVACRCAGEKTGALLDGQDMNAEDALVDLRYCTLAFF